MLSRQFVRSRQRAGGRSVYRRTLRREGAREKLGASVEIVKRNKLHTFVVLPKRWVVERSFSWLEKCRLLWKNCERTLIPVCNLWLWHSWCCYCEDLATGS